MTMQREPGARPARVLPVLYFSTAYVALLHAFLAAWGTPRSLIGFFYHSRLIGVVHLVTLGWITSVILGALFIAVPVALRVPLRPRRSDYGAYASYVIGVIGMVVHFWIGEFGGMAWSGIMVAAAIAHVGTRIVPCVLRSGARPPVKLHVTLAFANILLAATAGVALGFDKVHHFLPGYVISNVLAHAHLAAVGWASMMVLGLGFQLLPDRFEGAAPSVRVETVGVILLQSAAVGLFGSLLVGSRWSAVFAACAACAFGCFGLLLVQAWRDAAARGRPKSDVAASHLLQACAYGLVTAALGAWLAWIEPSESTLRVAIVYGVCGLVGLLMQATLALQMWLVPRASSRGRRAWLVYALWSATIPGIATGFLFEAPRLLSSAAWIGCMATLLTAVHMLPWVGATSGSASVSWTRDGLAGRSHSHELGVPQARA